MVAGGSTYMPITHYLLSLLGSTFILFISQEALNDYVVEGDGKLAMGLDNAPEYEYLE